MLKVLAFVAIYSSVHYIDFSIDYIFCFARVAQIVLLESIMFQPTLNNLTIFCNCILEDLAQV